MDCRGEGGEGWFGGEICAQGFMQGEHSQGGNFDRSAFRA